MWTPPSIAELPLWHGHKRVAIDIETYDPHLKELGPSVRRGGYIVGFSIAFELNRDAWSNTPPAWYVPIRHAGGGNVESSEKALEYLCDNAVRFCGELVGANLKYDLDYLAHEGIEFPHATLRDIQIADPLINELHQSYSLAAIAQRWGFFEGKDETLLTEAARDHGIDPKAGLWQLHSQYVGPYAERDASLPLEIYQKQRQELDKQDLFRIFELESRVLRAIIAMIRRGVRVDLSRLEVIQEQLYASELAELAKIKHQTGIEIASEDVWKARCIVPLFSFLGITLPPTPTGKPCVAENVISAVDDPSVASLLHARKLNKLRTTFCASISRFEVNGRIHCQFNQMKSEFGGAAYGRMSCSKPNLQQIPKRSTEGKLIREIFVPEEGEKWHSLDFSSQEPRLLFHYAYRTQCAMINDIVALFRENPTYDIYTPLKDRLGISRDDAKTIFLGKCYGMGGGRLSQRLGLPYEPYDIEGRTAYRALGEGQRIVDEFDSAAPYIRQLSQKCQDKAAFKGFITTIGGRKCRFPRELNGAYLYLHKALNRLIQGSAADQTKEALAQAHEAGIPIQLAIHDELTLSCPEHSLMADNLQDIMINAVKLVVPTVCEIKTASNWGEI